MAANGAGALRVPVVLGDAGEDDSDVYVLGLRASADNEAWSLLLMECDDAEDEQEIARGMDTYCLVVDPGQRTAYGGVLECELTDARLRLLLTEATATDLGVPMELSFTLALSADQLRTVRVGLERVLASGRTDAVPQVLNL